jgi:hypothetical protein
MKILFALLTGFISITTFAASDAAIEYNDKIINEQSKIGEKILAFSGDPNETTLQGIREQAQSSISVVSKMKPYEGNIEFKAAAIALFTFYSDITQHEYKDLLKLVANKDKYDQNKLTEKMNQLINSITSKEKPLDARFNEAQVAFAKKYGFTLGKNELQDEIDNAREGK